MKAFFFAPYCFFGLGGASWPSAGRYLERIAAHATNISEDGIYLMDVEIVLHPVEDYGDQ
jgi:hypothetical protein